MKTQSQPGPWNLPQEFGIAINNNLINDFFIVADSVLFEVDNSRVPGFHFMIWREA